MDLPPVEPFRSPLALFLALPVLALMLLSLMLLPSVAQHEPALGPPPAPPPAPPDPKAQAAWEAHLVELNKTGLDVVIVLDSTGSMGGIILETKTRIRQLMRVVQNLVPEARLGVVTYRDHKEFDPDDYEYTTKVLPLSKDLKPLQKFLNQTEAYGGGDLPEAVYDGLEVAINQSGLAKGSAKVIVLIGDAPPRPENDGLKKTYNLVEQWHKNTGGIVSCIDTGGSTGEAANRLMAEFKQIAASGGGDATSLNRDRDIIKQLAVYAFGNQWKTQIDNVYSSASPAPAGVKYDENIEGLPAPEPDNYLALLVRAHRLLKEGRLDEAESTARKVLSLAPNDADAQRQAQRILNDLSAAKPAPPPDTKTQPPATWEARLAELNKSGLDVVLVFDSTQPMDAVLAQTKADIRQLAARVKSLVPDSRIGLVAYRDHPQFVPNNWQFTTKSIPLTNDPDQLQKFLDETPAFGPGNTPQAVYEALQDATRKEKWRTDSKKVIILFGCAAPHPEDHGLLKVYALASQWRRSTGGIISCIDTTGGDHLMDEFKEIARSTGGEATFLNDPKQIARQLVVHIFGSAWQKQLDEIDKTGAVPPPPAPAPAPK